MSVPHSSTKEAISKHVKATPNTVTYPNFMLGINTCSLVHGVS